MGQHSLSGRKGYNNSFDEFNRNTIIFMDYGISKRSIAIFLIMLSIRLNFVREENSILNLISVAFERHLFHLFYLIYVRSSTDIKSAIV